MSLPKLFNRIIFHNNTTPAINEDNLNAISKGLSDVDDRVISLAGDVLEKAQAIIECSENPPYIGDNGNWYTWDTSTDPAGYTDSGIDASITVDIADVTALEPNQSPYVTNTGTDTDPIFHLYIPKGQNGTPGSDGQDGVSPEVTITTITGGHTVKITDADHPSGQSFNVMDGTGDMQKSTYDSANTVANAGGITAYVAGQIPSVSGKADKVSGATSGDLAELDSNGNLADSGYKSSDFIKSVDAGSTANVYGQIDVTYSKGNITGQHIYPSVYGWDKLVGSWTNAVTKSAGSTSCALTNVRNSTNVTVDPYCENSSGKPVAITSMSVTSSTITLNFAALSEQTTFKARVTLNS
jgi:hypothetical protein